MSQQNTALGPDAQITINSKAFAVIDGRYTDMSDVVETTDSLSNRAKEAAAGNSQFSSDITAQRINAVRPGSGNSGSNAQVSYYAAPVLLFPSSYISLNMYLDGIGLGMNPYLIPTFLIEELEGNWRVQGSEPQTLRFRGRSSGQYTTPDGYVIGSRTAGVGR